jgi:hypothetical protein
VFVQGGEQVGRLFEGLSLQMEAAAHAESLTDLFARLNASEQLLRLDESVAPTSYKAATVSAGELEPLRRIEQVVRLGRVRRIERDAIVLDQGTIPTSPRQLHVHCAAKGLNPAPCIPIFAEGSITLQPIRAGLIPFNAAMVGFVEASRGDVAEKNALCPPNLLPSEPIDWLRGTLVGMGADRAWSKAPDISAWLEGARLNPSRGLMRAASDPSMQSVVARYANNVRPGLAKLRELAAGH